MNTGIYAIQHTVSGRLYVGSAVNFAARWRVHLCLLRKGTHHSKHLQAAWNKYGEPAFVFKKLLVCTKEHLVMYEQRCIDGYRSFERKFGFNARREASSQLGMKHSESTRAKIRAARAKQVFSEETKALWSANRTGKKMPAWFSAFASSVHSGKKLSVETRAKMSISKTGSKFLLADIEKKSTVKLTGERAKELRAMYSAGGVSQSRLAALFGIDQSTVSYIVNNKRWNSI